MSGTGLGTGNVVVSKSRNDSDPYEIYTLMGKSYVHLITTQINAELQPHQLIHWRGAPCTEGGLYQGT